MKPILFNIEMVRGLLNGTKTVTRRVVKPQPKDWSDDLIIHSVGGGYITATWLPSEELVDLKLPYCPGDILYVRETWTHTCIHCEHYPDMFFCPPDCGTCPEFAYKADGGSLEGWPDKRWHPSIHMPREAARIFLRVTKVKVQRVQDITDSSIFAEGIRQGGWPPHGTLQWRHAQRADYVKLWYGLYAKPRPAKVKGVIHHYESYPWEDIRETRTYRGKPWYVIGNPWVWVTEFKRISKKEAQHE